MLAVQILILALILLVIPFYVGGIFTLVEKGRGKRMFQWISGQLLLWVGIEVIAVLLLMRGGGMQKAVVLFWCYIAAVICFSTGGIIRQRIWRGNCRASAQQPKGKRSFFNAVLWFLFGGLLIFQLAQVILTYDETLLGDVFYIDNPFALWIAFLSEVSGMSPIRVEQMVLPIVFLCMSYGVFYLLGAKFFVKKRVYHALFLVVLSVLAIGGRYLWKYISPDFWRDIRSKPELTLLGSVLVPYLVLLVIMIGRMLRKKKS